MKPERIAEIERAARTGSWTPPHRTIELLDALESAQAQIGGYEESARSHNKLVRELDVIWNGEAGAAKQASLCDMIAQIMNEYPKLAQLSEARRVNLDDALRTTRAKGVEG